MASTNSFTPAPLVAMLTCTIALATPLRAAVISWNSPTGSNISGDTDVSTSGALVYAYNFGDTGVATTTVNNVAFAPFTIAADLSAVIYVPVTVGSVTLYENAGYLWANNSLGANAAPFTALSASYQALLGTGGLASNASSIIITLGGLTSGRTYQLQWWSSNTAAAQGPGSEPMDIVTATSGSNVTTLSAQTGLGQHVTGTFVADATSQTFALDSLNSDYSSSLPLINALQLRDVTPSGVPETAGMIPIVGLSLLGVLSLHRRRSRGQPGTGSGR